ncbi:MAG: hypothetical protein ACD_7C00120G0001 [uncultured bacterium]|nr:MAG: hypothetical protein ACD_7C00120G0001 [uncultured bacterium]
MLLPGISGSYVLLVLGVYPLAIDAAANIFNYGSLAVLLFILIGIVLGFLVYPKLILLMFKKNHDLVMSFIAGLMIGSVRGLWPFNEYKTMIFKNKTFLICDKLYFPKIISLEFLLSCIFILFGSFVYYKIKKTQKKKNFNKVTCI